ncbi:MAG: hypothetical protein ACOYJD_00340 [Christensenellales bacterium]
MPSDSENVQAMATGTSAPQTDSAYTGRKFHITPQEAKAEAKRLKPVSDMLTTLSKEIGVPIRDTRFKRSMKKKAQGYYSPHSEVIVSRLPNDLQTVMHEIGHHLDKRYGLSKRDSVGAMISKLPVALQNAYKPAELREEAVAEFVKHYMINPEAAQTFGGAFYDVFESVLSKKHLDSIQKAQQDIINWYNADVWERSGTTIQSYTEPRRDAAQYKEWAITMFVDQYRPFKKFDDAYREGQGPEIDANKSVEVLARNSRYATNVAQTILQDNMVTPRGEVLDIGAFMDIFADMTPVEYQYRNIYLKNKHALDWAAQGKRVYTDDININDVLFAKM